MPELNGQTVSQSLKSEIKEIVDHVGLLEQPKQCLIESVFTQTVLIKPEFQLKTSLHVVTDSLAETDVMVDIHQVLGHIGLKPVLSLVTCTDLTTDVKIISSHHVDYTATQPLPTHHLALPNVDQDITLHTPKI
jgi:hypothetical protein